MDNLNTINKIQSGSDSSTRSKETLPEMLTETLRCETVNDRKWSAIVRVCANVASGLGIALLGWLVISWIKSPFGPQFFVLIPVSIALLWVGISFNTMFEDRKRKQGRMIHKLKDHSVALAPAMELVHSRQDAQVLQSASAVLKSHLDTLDGTSYMSITAAQRASLRYILSGPICSEDPELAIAAIRALKIVGDETVLDTINSVAANSACSSQMRSEALDCFKTITSNLQKRRQAKTLLRPGENNGTIHSSLLRPTVISGTETENGEQLLRIVNE